ncbi:MULTISPECIES: hypothetical protein [Burkholderia]|uniref:hypothetical protein n=1 Tax=Burkholderia TaxID=32008 RepID=UPI000F5DD597|nr:MULTISPECIES: hypothetical protein [Burkholderia]
MNNEERQDYLYGEIAALACAVRALIEHHPNKPLVTAQFEANLEQTDAFALPETISESYRDALTNIRTYLLASPSDSTP